MAQRTELELARDEFQASRIVDSRLDVEQAALQAQLRVLEDIMQNSRRHIIDLRFDVQRCCKDHFACQQNLQRDARENLENPQGQRNIIYDYTLEAMERLRQARICVDNEYSRFSTWATQLGNVYESLSRNAHAQSEQIRQERDAVRREDHFWQARGQ